MTVNIFILISGSRCVTLLTLGKNWPVRQGTGGLGSRKDATRIFAPGGDGAEWQKR